MRRQANRTVILATHGRALEASGAHRLRMLLRRLLLDLLHFGLGGGLVLVLLLLLLLELLLQRSILEQLLRRYWLRLAR